MHPTAKPEFERAVAVGITRRGISREQAIEHLDELEFLAETAGAMIMMKILQDRDRPDVATVIGKGKVAEVKAVIDAESITLAIFDDDLSPAQVRNLEKAWEIKVLDRSGLILDIFASRARTVQAKTQVELAQLQYLLPRLSRMWTHLSKQFGGIGTKGPGETQIETDRRLIRVRIMKLQEKLKEITMQKEQQRKGRSSMPRFALVGYTNAGKSTLMNAITEAGVYVENKLFATLDTTTRAMLLPSGQKGLLSDTVGFIRKLPTHLVASFNSTLAEAAEADALLHVVDASHPAMRDHVRVVKETLETLKLEEKPVLLVFNKIDLLEDVGTIHDLEREFPDAVFVSAHRGINLSQLLLRMQHVIDEGTRRLYVLVPYASMALVAHLYEAGEVTHRADTEEGIEMTVNLSPDEFRRLQSVCARFVREEKVDSKILNSEFRI